MAKACKTCGCDRTKVIADRKILERILEILFWDSVENKWDKNKAWDVDFLDDIASEVVQSDLYKRYLARSFLSSSLCRTKHPLHDIASEVVQSDLYKRYLGKSKS